MSYIAVNPCYARAISYYATNETIGVNKEPYVPRFFVMKDGKELAEESLLKFERIGRYRMQTAFVCYAKTAHVPCPITHFTFHWLNDELHVYTLKQEWQQNLCICMLHETVYCSKPTSLTIDFSNDLPIQHVSVIVEYLDG